MAHLARPGSSGSSDSPSRAMYIRPSPLVRVRGGIYFQREKSGRCRSVARFPRAATFARDNLLTHPLLTQEGVERVRARKEAAAQAYF